MLVGVLFVLVGVLFVFSQGNVKHFGARDTAEKIRKKTRRDTKKHVGVPRPVFFCVPTCVFLHLFGVSSPERWSTCW